MSRNIFLGALLLIIWPSDTINYPEIAIAHLQKLLCQIRQVCSYNIYVMVSSQQNRGSVLRFVRSFLFPRSLSSRRQNSALIRQGFRRMIIPTTPVSVHDWMASDLGGIPDGRTASGAEKSRERLNETSTSGCGFILAGRICETGLRIIMAK